MADIIIDLTKLREAQAAADATAHLHEILCIAAEATATRALNAEGRLADIAPTLLELMELPKPKEMTGQSLLRGN